MMNMQPLPVHEVQRLLNRQNTGFFNTISRAISSAWSFCANVFNSCFNRDNIANERIHELNGEIRAEQVNIDQQEYQTPEFNKHSERGTPKFESQIQYQGCKKNKDNQIQPNGFQDKNQQSTESTNQKNEDINGKQIPDYKKIARTKIINDIIQIFNETQNNNNIQEQLNSVLQLIHVDKTITKESFNNQNQELLSLSTSQLLALKIFFLSYLGKTEERNVESQYNTNNILKDIETVTKNDILLLTKQGPISDTIEFGDIIYETNTYQDEPSEQPQGTILTQNIMEQDQNKKINKHRLVIFTKNEKNEITEICKSNAEKTNSGTYNCNVALDEIKGEKIDGKRQNRKLLSVQYNNYMVEYGNFPNKTQSAELEKICNNEKIPVVFPKYYNINININIKNKIKPATIQEYIEGLTVGQQLRKIYENPNNIENFKTIGFAIQKGIEYYIKLQDNGILHSDNNRGNVIITKNNDSTDIKIIDVADLNKINDMKNPEKAIFNYPFGIIQQFNNNLQWKSITNQKNKILLSHLIGMLSWLPVTQEVQILFVYVLSQFHNLEYKSRKDNQNQDIFGISVTRKNETETCLNDNEKTKQLLNTITNVMYNISNNFINNTDNKCDLDKKQTSILKNNGLDHLSFWRQFYYKNQAFLEYEDNSFLLNNDNKLDLSKINSKIDEMSTNGQKVRKELEPKENKHNKEIQMNV